MHLLSTEEHTEILNIIDVLHHSLDSEKICEQVGHLLLDLFKADYFSSSTWNENTNHLITCSKKMQYHDKQVNDDEYQRFLAMNVLHNSIHFHVDYKNKNIGEIRMWRRQSESNFSEKEHHLLEIIKPHFCNAMRNIYCYEQQCYAQNNTIPTLDLPYLTQKYSLTPREADVIFGILQGKQDKLIAKQLNIAFSTLRTHLKNIFLKLAVNNRILLLNRIYLDVLLDINKNR